MQQINDCWALLQLARPNNDADRWAWIANQDFKFSVGSIRKLLQPDPNQVIKVNVFGWRTIREIMPTKKALTIRGVQLDNNICSVCDDYEEDMDHLLIACEPHSLNMVPCCKLVQNPAYMCVFFRRHY